MPLEGKFAGIALAIVQSFLAKSIPIAHKYKTDHFPELVHAQALVARTYHPPFSNFLFTNLFSIKFLYFFIISSLFPYFNLFVSKFVQSYANIKFHVSTLYRYMY